MQEQIKLNFEKFLNESSFSNSQKEFKEENFNKFLLKKNFFKLLVKMQDIFILLDQEMIKSLLILRFWLNLQLKRLILI